MLYLLNTIVLSFLTAWGYSLKSKGQLPSIPYLEDKYQIYVLVGIIVVIVFNLLALVT